MLEKMVALRDVEYKEKGVAVDVTEYKTVLRELISMDERLSGKCDPLRYNKGFISGIWYVMRVIAYCANEFDEFEDLFVENNIDSWGTGR